MKRFFWPAIETLAIVLLVAGAICTMKGIFGNRYEAELAAIKAKGEPTTVQELVGDPIPDDRNAAIPYMQLSADIKSTAYEQALKTIEDFPSNPGPYLPADSWKKAERALTETQPLRQLIDDAVSRPKCRFDLNTTDPLAMRFPYLTALRRAQLMLRLSALTNAGNGRMEQAIEDIGTQIRVVQSLWDQPFLIDHMVRLTLLSVASKNVQAVADFGGLSEAQARRLFDMLGKLDLAESCRRAWLAERVCYICLSDPQYFTRAARSAYSPSSGTSASQALTGQAYSLWGQTLLRGDTAVSLHYATEQIEGAGLSYKETRAKGLLDPPDDLPFYAIVSKLMIPSGGSLGLRRFAVEADLAETRVFLALQGYKDRFGGYPTSIQELESKLGWKLPKDPFSGKDLIYKRQNAGFILYSIGPDMKDDGGRQCANQRPSLDDKGDIVLTWGK